jgi:hypothetical protein
MGLPERGQAAGWNHLIAPVLLALRDLLRALGIVDAVSVSVRLSKLAGDDFVAAGRSCSPPDLVRTLRPHLRLRGEFLRLLELSTVSLVLPIMLAALTAVVLCRVSSPAQYGGTPVPSQRPFGCPRSSASGAPCARPGSPHVVSSVLAGRPLCSRSSSIFILACSFQFAPSSGSISVLAHVIQHPNEQPSGNIPSPSTVRF